MTCTWGNLDLSPFLQLSPTRTVNCTDSTHGYQFYYLPCTNNLQCTNVGGAMVIQARGDPNGCVKDMAVWDGGHIEPTHALNEDGLDEWVFYYPNGENDPGHGGVCYISY